MYICGSYLPLKNGSKISSVSILHEVTLFKFVIIIRAAPCENVFGHMPTAKALTSAQSDQDLHCLLKRIL